MSLDRMSESLRGLLNQRVWPLAHALLLIWLMDRSLCIYVYTDEHKSHAGVSTTAAQRRIPRHRYREGKIVHATVRSSHHMCTTTTLCHYIEMRPGEDNPGKPAAAATGILVAHDIEIRARGREAGSEPQYRIRMTCKRGKRAFAVPYTSGESW